jgi:putative ABC transport system substrate-binding protein
VKRREFIAGLGAAAARPITARAQQPAMPVIGFLSSVSSDAFVHLLRTFRQGMAETGYVEGRNVAIEYRWADGHNDRLPAFAADVVHRQVNVIVATSGPSIPAAKAATATIPIVFYTPSDPVEVGYVASLNRPGGNLTGITSLSAELISKRLELLHELVPAASDIGLLVNPTNPIATEAVIRDAEAAARTLALQLHILRASTEHELDGVFATLFKLPAGGLVIGTDPFFTSRSELLAALAVRYSVPTVYQYREFTEAGGLMSYGTSITAIFRQVGVYTGRILRGDKPADLPVQQSTKVELFLNLKTAKALGLIAPLSLLGRADEVIE